MRTTSLREMDSRGTKLPGGDLAWARGPIARGVRSAFDRAVLGPIVQYYGHTKVTGLENLKGLRPPFLIAANHASHLDTPAILMALPSRLRRRTLVAAASDYFFDAPWKGVMVALALGAIAVERRRASRRSLRTLRGLLAEGWNIIVFPEGGRSPDGHLRSGKRGVAHLAVAAGVPVLPVGVLGTFAVHARRLPLAQAGSLRGALRLPPDANSVECGRLGGGTDAHSDRGDHGVHRGADRAGDFNGPACGPPAGPGRCRPTGVALVLSSNATDHDAEVTDPVDARTDGDFDLPRRVGYNRGAAWSSGSSSGS
jgi:1-acyl-sn-glycerol-3-phosphate acyltransferase